MSGLGERLNKKKRIYSVSKFETIDLQIFEKYCLLGERLNKTIGI